MGPTLKLRHPTKHPYTTLTLSFLGRVSSTLEPKRDLWERHKALQKVALHRNDTRWPTGPRTQTTSSSNYHSLPLQCACCCRATADFSNKFFVSSVCNWRSVAATHSPAATCASAHVTNFMTEDWSHPSPLRALSFERKPRTSTLRSWVKIKRLVLQ